MKCKCETYKRFSNVYIHNGLNKNGPDHVEILDILSSVLKRKIYENSPEIQQKHQYNIITASDGKKFQNIDS